MRWLFVSNWLLYYGVDFRFVHFVVYLGFDCVFESFLYRVSNLFFQNDVDEIVELFLLFSQGPQCVCMFIQDVLIFD